MKWSGSKDRYDLPGDLDSIDRATVALLLFALGLLWLIVAYAVPSLS